eukprot:1880907-Amphidinium_carterae.1
MVFGPGLHSVLLAAATVLACCFPVCVGCALVHVVAARTVDVPHDTTRAPTQGGSRNNRTEPTHRMGKRQKSEDEYIIEEKKIEQNMAFMFYVGMGWILIIYGSGRMKQSTEILGI